MKVLLVEDDDNKRSQIGMFLNDSLSEVEVLSERSLQSGLRRLRREPPELILLDMTLPNYDPGPDEPGGQPQSFGGREFLCQMDRFEICVPVIVVTQFATFGRGSTAKDLKGLDEELRHDHPRTYKGAVYYNSAIQEWKEELKARITKALEGS